ncbi:MAG TPA: DUF2336 domain-containing protein [Rhizomicrobium sp.]|jgi:uncharacterized protein (DUF2336 family)
MRPDRKDLPELLSRDDVLRILEERDRTARAQLAGRADAPPESLFFLAREGSDEARRAVAANPSTPAHANRLLADDTDDEVRTELARKIGRLMPQLSREQSKKLRMLTIETLERLAKDALPRVRAVLAQEIKSLDCVPRRVIRALARDVEQVSAPILEYSPLLSDADLLDIITTAQARFALTAIARRRPLGASVSEAIAVALDVPAVAELLSNSQAQIRQRTLDKIVDHAAKVRAWHLPLVLRGDLSQRAIRRIAGFVSGALIEKLSERQSLDDKTRQQLNQRMRARIDEGDTDDAPDHPKINVEALFRAGKLDDGFVEAAAESGHRDQVAAALAFLARAPLEVVQRVLQTATARPVTALVWRAGLSMRAAFKIQRYVLRLKASELLPARAGIDFPMSEDEMRWHLDYFGI